MKKWNTPAIDSISVEVTANVDAPSNGYDYEWANNENGYYLLGDGVNKES